MSSLMLPQSRSRPGRAAALAPVAGVEFVLGRVHEICGPARHRAGLWLAGQAKGVVLWVAPERGGAPLNPDGFARLLEPSRLIFAVARRPEDVLWAMEEGLRSGQVGAVVADLPGPPGLTPVRRLHLAAEGAVKSAAGAPGVESRWQMVPRHGPGRARWQFRCLRARGLGALPDLELEPGPEGRGMTLV
jgi:protein ImuA